MDVHLGHRPVRGSQRVYKAELNGEMHAAKVIHLFAARRLLVSACLRITGRPCCVVAHVPECWWGSLMSLC